MILAALNAIQYVLPYRVFLSYPSFRTPEFSSTSVWWEDQHFTATCHLRTGGHSTTLLWTGEDGENKKIKV